MGNTIGNTFFLFLCSSTFAYFIDTLIMHLFIYIYSMQKFFYLLFFIFQVQFNKIFTKRQIQSIICYHKIAFLFKILTVLCSIRFIFFISQYSLKCLALKKIYKFFLKFIIPVQLCLLFKIIIIKLNKPWIIYVIFIKILVKKKNIIVNLIKLLTFSTEKNKKIPFPNILLI